MQVSPAQQPDGHEAASHWQPPPSQLWPAPHWAALPHRHAPVLEHAFAFVMSHAEHDEPVAPHAPALVGVLQPPSAPQQPPTQDVESQTQALFTQRCPVAQAAELGPHWHTPALEHRSALALSQPTQAWPAPAHDERARAVQAAPEQQPLGHDVASHSQEPLRQTCPRAQEGTQAIVPPPPPAPPPRAPPSSRGQLSRQKPSQHPAVPRQSLCCAHEVMPSVDGSEQLQAWSTSASARMWNCRFIVTPSRRARRRPR